VVQTILVRQHHVEVGSGKPACTTVRDDHLVSSRWWCITLPEDAVQPTWLDTRNKWINSHFFNDVYISCTTHPRCIYCILYRLCWSVMAHSYLYVHVHIPSLYLDLCVLGSCEIVRYCCTVGTRSTSISLHSQ
jgi:hypothetical protein